jgi:hypothetical protein
MRIDYGVAGFEPGTKATYGPHIHILIPFPANK